MSFREKKEMEALLVRAGYAKKLAQTLQREGMGAYDLEDRLKIPPFEVGGLYYTHKALPKGWPTGTCAHCEAWFPLDEEGNMILHRAFRGVGSCEGSGTRDFLR